MTTGGEAPAPDGLETVASAPGSTGDRVITIPNLITAGRLACLPVFVYLLAQPQRRDLLAAGFFLGGLGFTDTLDGYIARRFHQVSRIGKVADPLVDRLLVTSAAVGAAWVRAMPWWLLALVLARELLMLVGGVVLALRGLRQLDVTRAGKAGALGMMAALPWFLIGHSHFRLHSEFTAAAWVAAAFGLGLAWLAALGYVPQARRQLEAAQGQPRLGKG